MKTTKALSFLTMLLLSGSLGAQQPAPSTAFPHSSQFLNPSRRDAVRVPFILQGRGIPTPISWGMDTAWDDEGNVIRGVNFIGKDNLTYGRVSFQVMDPVKEDGTLSDRQLKYLQARLQHIKLTQPDGVLLNSDPVDINLDVFRKNPEAWYKVIKATTKYVMESGLKVVAVAPFNEPDVTANNQGTKEDFRAIVELLRADPFFDNIRISAGNTCNNDCAMEWYDYMKPYVDEGNTHQLAGDFTHYADFYTHIRQDGNVATNDELHNVMEGIVGVQYGMQNGIWWGTVGPARGDFCLATSPGGARLGYAENRAAWTGAAVYRMPDGRVKAFAGASERQAFPCAYDYVSTDKPAYFDGYGPSYSYTTTLPGGYRYGDEYQCSAERSIQICQGEDVPICPLDAGDYILVNKKTQKLLTISSGSTSNSAAVVQYANKNYKYQQWTLESLSDNLGDLTGFYLHSVRNANMNMETGGFQVQVGGTVSVYPTTKAENQRWTFEYAGDGYYRIRNYQSGLYLEIPGGSTANNVAVRLCNLAPEDQQLWRLLPVDAPCEQTPPAVPVGLVATPRQHAVLLSWAENTQDKDLAGFMVLRGEKNAQGEVEYDVIGRNVKGCCFLDNDCRENVTYYYAVQSVDYSQNRSQKSEPVVAAPTCEAGLVAWYDFEHTPTDQSENQLDAVLARADGFTSGADCRSGRLALLLDGTSNYLCLPPAAVCLPNVTFALWVNHTGGITPGSRLFDFAADETRFATLSLNASGTIQLHLKQGNQEQTVEGGAFPQGWHHLAVTLGTDSICIYVDGMLSGQAVPASVRLSDIRPVRNLVGCGQTPDVPLMNGILDDLRIYNYSLGVAEIQALMREAAAGEEICASWPQPTLPSKAVGDISAVEAIYLYNVDADAFVTYGMNYNTQAVAQRLAKGDASQDSRFKVRVSRVGEGQIRLSMVDKLLSYIGCLDDACNVWSDRSLGESLLTYQEALTPAGSLYTLVSETQQAPLDVTYAYGGPLTTRHGRGFIHWAFVPAKDIQNSNYAKYKQRKTLYSLRQALTAAGKEADFANELKEVGAVYLNADATVGELQTAAHNLLLVTATQLNGTVDATVLFDNADMLGGKTTADWTSVTTTLKDGVIEVKNKPFTLEQTQSDLPLGVYDVVFHGFYTNTEKDTAPYVTGTTSSATAKANLPERTKVKAAEVMLEASESTAGAAQMLTSDKAQVALEDILVSDNRLTLSLDVKSSTQCVDFQGFSISYRPLLTLQVPASGYTTFYYGTQSFLLPEGMKAYTLKETTEGFAVSQHYTAPGTVLPAGQAVVLKAAPGLYTLLPTTKSKNPDRNNCLKGSDRNERTTGGNFYYTLDEEATEGAVWHWAATDGATFVNPAHKAYLVSEKETKADSFALDVLTALQEVNSTDSRPSAAYNLQGQRVDDDYRYLRIENGKKLIRRTR